MRKIKLYAIVSMDGCISRKDGDIDWLLEQYNALDTDYGLKAYLDSTDTILLNRNYYQLLLGYDLAETIMSKPCIMIVEEGFKMSEKPNVEFIETPPRDYTDAMEILKTKKEEEGGDIFLAGDNRLIWACFENNLVDEIVLMMLPVKMEEDGAKLFPDGFYEKKWHPWDKKYYPNGVIQIKYKTTPKNNCN